MRAKIFFRAAAIAILALFVLAPLANARTKHCKGSAKLVGMPSQTTVNIDDVPNHKLQLTVYIFDHTCDCEEFAEFRQMSQAYDDMVGGSSSTLGYYTDYLKGGDKSFGKWSSKSKTETKKDGSWEIVISGEWEQTGATGKLKDTKGKGTFSGKVTPAGFLYEWEGDFEFPD